MLWVIAGLFMAMIPAIHPEIPELRQGPGAFLIHHGTQEVIVFLAGHVLFGVVVGFLYALWHPAAGPHAVA